MPDTREPVYGGNLTLRGSPDGTHQFMIRKRSHLKVTLVCDQIIQRNRTGGIRLNARRFVQDFPEMAGKTIEFNVNGTAMDMNPAQAEWLFNSGFLTTKRPGYWGPFGGNDRRLELLVAPRKSDSRAFV